MQRSKSRIAALLGELRCGKPFAVAAIAVLAVDHPSDGMSQTSPPITVTMLDDRLDMPCSDITIAALPRLTDERVSLREAVCAANNTPGPNTIVFAQAGVYGLTLTGAGEDDNATGDLDIVQHDLTITHPTPRDVVIHAVAAGTDSDRVFHVLPAARLQLEGVTIRRGAPAGSGGGILNEGELVLRNVVVTDNQATQGGGLYNAGCAEVQDTAFLDNRADDRGGGIYNGTTAALEATQIEIRGNQAHNGGGLASQGDATVMNSQIVENAAAQLGGGIYGETGGQLSLSATEVMRNTAAYGAGISSLGTLEKTGGAISANLAGPSGGGLYVGGNYAQRATATLTNVAMRDNRAGSAPQPGPFAFHGQGGAINARYADVTLTASNLVGNEIMGYGGAVFARHSDIQVQGSTVRGNVATQSGGGLAVLDSDMTMTDSTVDENSSNHDGGGIYIGSNRTQSATIERSTIVANRSRSESGGGIAVGGIGRRQRAARYRAHRRRERGRGEPGRRHRRRHLRRAVRTPRSPEQHDRRQRESPKRRWHQPFYNRAGEHRQQHLHRQCRGGKRWRHRRLELVLRARAQHDRGQSKRPGRRRHLSQRVDRKLHGRQQPDRRQRGRATRAGSVPVTCRRSAGHRRPPPATAGNLYGHDAVTTAAALDGLALAATDRAATGDGRRPMALPDIVETTLGEHSGKTPTLVLVAVSLAIEMADASKCPGEDQRGAPRPQGRYCDAGAFEYQGGR